MAERSGRVRREQARVRRYGVLWSRVLEGYLCGHRSHHLRSAPRSREGHFDEPRVRPLWVWCRGDICRVVCTGNWTRQCRGRDSKTEGSVMSSTIGDFSSEKTTSMTAMRLLERSSHLQYSSLMYTCHLLVGTGDRSRAKSRVTHSTARSHYEYNERPRTSTLSNSLSFRSTTSS